MAQFIIFTLLSKNMLPENLRAFHCKQFAVWQNEQVFKVGTDGVLLGAWVDVGASSKILEVGTGTGLIALMIAQRNNQAQITAIDIDEISATIARYNVEESKFAVRVEVVHKSLQNFEQSCDAKFDLIVSNPPYFIDSTKSSYTVKNDKRHTSELSQIDLATSAVNLLKNEGELSVILPVVEGNLFVDVCKDVGLYLQRKTVVYPKKSKAAVRLMLSFCKSSVIPEVIDKNLFIHNEQKERTYTTEYVELTKGFYLFM